MSNILRVEVCQKCDHVSIVGLDYVKHGVCQECGGVSAIYLGKMPESIILTQKEAEEQGFFD